MKQRIAYIDATKGVLILLLVFGHTVLVAGKYLPNENIEYMSWIESYYTSFGPYYMQTFFFITGLCSNFNKPLRTFFKQNCKTLLIPYVIFSLLGISFSYCMTGQFELFVNNQRNLRSFFLVEAYWFLSALFMTKMIMWYLNRFAESLKWQFALIVFLFVCSVEFVRSLSPDSHTYNYFHWFNAIYNLPFLWMGYVVSCLDSSQRVGGVSLVDKKMWLFCMAYVIGLLVCINLRLPIPFNAHLIVNAHLTIPFFFFFAICGTFMIIKLSSLIPKNRFLDFLGKNTIVVYGIHFIYLKFFAMILTKAFIPTSYLTGIMFYLTMAGLSIITSYLTCILFQYRPFKWLIGRF